MFEVLAFVLVGLGIAAVTRSDELLAGGRADGRKPSSFDPVQLRKGTKVELEHTRDPRVAQEIAMDHLVEDERYYHALEKMEKRLARARKKRR